MEPRAVAFGMAVGAALAAVAGAAEIRITHAPRPCALAGHPARIEAQIEAAGADVRARVHFRKEGEDRFYSVEMRREGDRWAGILPSPAPGTTRIGYYISVATDGSRRRLPDSSAFVLDVVTSPCAEGTLPESAQGPRELGVPRGAPRTPPGFEVAGIAAFVEDPGDAMPSGAAADVPASPAFAIPIAPGSRVRAVTSPDDHRREGRLVSVDRESLVLDAGKDRVRIPRTDIASLEVHEGGSSGMKVLGGLIGGVAGLALTALVCASADACDSVAVAWVGFGVGAAAGAALTGRGDWKPITLARSGPVALDLGVRKEAAALRMRVSF